MNLCYQDHDEICYSSRDCPLCAVKKDLLDQLETADDAIKDLKSELDQAGKLIIELQKHPLTIAIEDAQKRVDEKKC